MVGEQPKCRHQYDTDNNDQDSLHVDKGTGDQITLVHENRQGVLEADETKIPEQFQYGQADTKCGDSSDKACPRTRKRTKRYIKAPSRAVRRMAMTALRKYGNPSRFKSIQLA